MAAAEADTAEAEDIEFSAAVLIGQSFAVGCTVYCGDVSD